MLGNKELGIQSKEEDFPWMLEFDGSCCSSGFGAGVVLISPIG